jgi:hypothetical protein
VGCDMNRVSQIMKHLEAPKKEATD